MILHALTSCDIEPIKNQFVRKSYVINVWLKKFVLLIEYFTFFFSRDIENYLLQQITPQNHENKEC